MQLYKMLRRRYGARYGRSRSLASVAPPCESELGRARIVILGSLAPPIGGVSSHVARLAGVLHRCGLACTVLDLYPRAGKAASTSFEHRISPVSPRLFALIWASLSLRRDGSDIVHMHLSRVRGAVLALTILRLAPHRRLILTLHHGDQEGVLSRSGFVIRRLARFLLPRLDRVVALSYDQECFYRRQGVGDDRIVRWTSAPPLSELPDTQALPAALHGLNPVEQGGAEVVLVASGYLLPSYRYEMALALHRALLDRRPSRLVLCFYGDEGDKEYEARILAEAASTPGVTVVNAMTPAGFLALLCKASVYLRPSLIDSYGLAISEALDVGARALASDVCERDPRSVTFATHDQAEFLAKGLSMFEGKIDRPCAGMPPKVLNTDFVLDTYSF